MEARRHPEFAEVLRRATLVLPDGIGVVWASRLLGGRCRSGCRASS